MNAPLPDERQPGPASTAAADASGKPGTTWSLPPGPTAALTVLLSWLVAAAFLAGSLDLLHAPQPGDIGAGTFPALVAVGLALAGTVVGWRTWRGLDALPLHWPQPLATLGTGLAVVLMVVLWGPAQAVPGSAWGLFALFAVGLQFLLGERRPRWLWGGSLVLAATLWLIFGRLLQLPL